MLIKSKLENLIRKSLLVLDTFYHIKAKQGLNSYKYAWFIAQPNTLQLVHKIISSKI